MAAQTLQVDFVTPSIARVQWVNVGNLQDNATSVCVYSPSTVKYTHEVKNGYEEYSTSELIVRVDPKSHALSFIDPRTNNLILSEDSSEPHSAHPVVQEKFIYDEASAHTVETANGKVTVRDIMRRDTIGTSMCYNVRFTGHSGEALYGLGSHEVDYLNLVGKTLYLTQHNLKATIPMLCSTGGYGILFDAGCAMKFVSDGKGYEMELEAAKELDYYFIKGETLEEEVAGYRYLTGAPSLMPRFLFGYTQSKERYKSSAEIIQTLREYRRRHVPIDMIVQDWNYWPEGWGYLKMDPKYYPDPKALADTVHSLNARLMVSIWANPQRCPEAEDFRNRGMMLDHDVYDAFSPEARAHYWQYVDSTFFSKGFDAWWCDSSEPVDGDWNQMPEPIDGRPYAWTDYERRWNLNRQVLGEALGAERSSLYSLYHSRGIYENMRKAQANDSKQRRVVNLTRSTYAGQQRNGTIVWNGDTHASWDCFRQQIPSGLNYMVTGSPYWTVDVGGFFALNDGHRWFYCGEYPEGVKTDAFREYYTRMFQWATFLPVLRSHGSDTPREIWQFGEPGTPYYDAIREMIGLRYRLIPYIYSMAAQQTMGSYTMARLLAFDFPEDPEVLDLKDEYMFGDLLVCPVTHPVSETSVRKVYLPKGAEWIDYHSGKRYQGGQWLDYDVSTIAKYPLFVRDGTILVTTDETEYADVQIGKELTINVYGGRDASFIFYEDEGDGYNYEKGDFCKIPITWNEKAKTLTLDKIDGTFKGMSKSRKIHIVFQCGKTLDAIYVGKTLSLQAL